MIAKWRGYFKREAAHGGYDEDESMTKDEKITAAPDLLNALEEAESFIKAVIDGYTSHVSHHDYRVQVAVWAEDALPIVSEAIKKAKGE